jgi:hypothetical protein
MKVTAHHLVLRLGSAPAFMLVSCLAYSTQKMEMIGSSEESVDFQWTTSPYIPEDSSALHNHRCENLESYTFYFDSYNCNVKDKVIPVLNYIIMEGTWRSGGVVIPFLTSTLSGDEWSASCPCCFILRYRAPATC